MLTLQLPVPLRTPPPASKAAARCGLRGQSDLRAGSCGFSPSKLLPQLMPTGAAEVTITTAGTLA